jgi:uncharacterized damage-inducible protein DinB
MQFTKIEDFLSYYTKVKKRTARLLAYIPPDKIEWSYAEGKFTIGDLIRHLACIERYMYAENVQLKPSRYSGCGTDLAEGYEATIAFYHRLHEESLAIFSKLTPEDLQQKCTTPGEAQISTWKWLRLMAEHEIHHRGQLYMYLGMLGVVTPPIYGLTSEEVAKRGKSE